MNRNATRLALAGAGRAARAARALLLALSAIGAGLAWAQAINDVPMAVKNNVPPNFMFMIDNSGSMSNIVPTTPFDASVNYSGACPAASSSILIPAAGADVDINIVSGIPYARINGSSTDRRHTSLNAGGNQVCFIDNATYDARLLHPVSTGYLPSVYTGRYLNWYFGNYASHPTTGWSSRKVLSAAAIAAGHSVRTRLEIAKASAAAIVGPGPNALPASDTNPLVRIGLSTYNNGDGGTLLRGMADLTTTHRTNVQSSITALAASGNTPLAETLADIGRYMATGYSGNITAGTVTGISINEFLRQDGRQSCLSGANCLTTTTDAVPATPETGTPTRPIQYWCQRSYAFMLTDGRPQGDQAFTNNTYLRDYDRDCTGPNAANCVGGSPNWDRKLTRQYESAGSDYLDDVAKALFDVDLRPNLVAPASRPKKNNLLTYTIGFADLQVQNDPLLIATAQQGGGRFLNAQDETTLTTAFRDVVSDALAKDAAAAAVAVVNAQITLNNIGYASSYTSGSWYGNLQAYTLNTSTGLPIDPPVWSFKDKLAAQTPATRKIVSFNGTQGRPFTGTNFGGTPATLTAGVIDYIRGVRTGEGTTYRTRQFVMGDVINAEPVVMNYGGNTPIIFQAANDGMLHVIDGRTDGSATQGTELWAYVPRLVHANLHELASTSYQHRYFVDATPAAAEVTSLPFSRLLVGGLGKGGRGYYALDVSSFNATSEADAASKVLWEFDQSRLSVGQGFVGFSFGTPLIVRTAAGWRVLVTSGYDNGSAVGGDGVGRVWVLDPSTGNVLATLTATSPLASASNPSGLAHLSRLSNSAPDAEVRFVYGGDLHGNVFRFDLVNNTSTLIATLTDPAGARQPVTSAPEVANVANSSTRFAILLGTGRYLADEDVPGNAAANVWATQRQSMYGIFDDTTVTSPTLPNLSRATTCPTGGGSGDFVCQSLTFNTSSGTYQATDHAVDPTTRRGWVLDLPQDARLTNGRVFGKPALTTGGTLVISVNVPTNLRCDPGGSSWLLMLRGVTGGAVPVVLNGNTYFDAGYSQGFALASRPVIIQTATEKRALLRMYDTTFRSVKIEESASITAPWRRIYWRSVN